MIILLDTNILTRAAEPAHPQHSIATAAVDALVARGDVLCIVPQNLYEFWVVATRPTEENGLGLTVELARDRLAELKRAFQLLDETPAVCAAWEELVAQHAVKGKSAHDARLVAAMRIHGISSLLTFNQQHFTRYSEIAVITPEQARSGAIRSS